MLIVFTNHVQAQLHFEHVSTGKGLSNNTVNGITQDIFGRIWLATYDGLTYFDGINYSIVRHVPNTENNIPSGEALQILADSLGYVWIVFENQQLIQLYHSNGHCKTYNELSKKLTHQLKLNLDSIGNLLIIDTLHHYRYNNELEEFEMISVESLPNPKTRINELQIQLSKLAPDAIVSSYFEHNSTGDVWIATLNEGIFKVPGGNFSRIENYHARLQVPHNISNDEVYSIFVDNAGGVWAGTKDGGVSRGYERKYQFNTLKSEDLLITPAKGGAIRAILKANDSSLWLGTYNNGIIVRRNNLLNHIDLAKNKQLDKWNWVRSLYQSNDGKIWIGTYAGLCMLDTKTGKKEYYKPCHNNNNNNNSITNGRIYSIAENNDENLFIAEWGSLSFFNRKYNEIKRIDTLNNISGKHIRKLLVDKNNKLWVGTESNGVYVLNTKTYEVEKHFVHSPTETNSLNSNSIFEIYQDKEGSMWIGNFGGINKITPSYQVENLSYVNQQLPSTLVYRIFTDEQDKIWCSTPHGIVSIDKTKMRVYDKSDGCSISEFSEGAGYMDKEGVMYFGGVKGVSYFYPDSIIASNIVPNVMLSSFSINGEQSEYSYLASSQNHYYSLSPNEDKVQFELTSISLGNPIKNQIAWKLEPYDSNFEYSFGPHSTITYRNLPYGEYTLLAKTCNADGTWSPAKELIKLRIEKPFWAEFYFSITFLLLIVILAILIGKLRIEKIKKSNIQLEELVNKRTLKIETQNKTLEEKNIRLEEQNSEILAQRDHISAQRDHLLEMHEKLEEANTIKQKFFTNISHDIRTPLSLILGPVNEIIASKSLPRDIQPKLKRIQNNTNYILQLLNQVLDKKKLEMGGLKLVYTQGDLVKECKDILLSFTDEAINNNIDLQFKSNKEHYETRFDHDKLQQVIFNLVANAIKFTPAQGTISCLLLFRDDMLDVIIEDTGIGIPSNRINHIFDRYYQIGKSRNSFTEGTGIGLSLVKDYVDLMAGEVSVESVEGEGSTFTVNLPLTVSVLEESIAVNNRITGTVEDISYTNTTSDSINSKENLLLVEDNTELTQYLKEVLENQFNVYNAENGKEAIKLLNKQVNFQIILSDWMMSEMDGIELCTTIKKKSKYNSIPFVLLTALSDIDNQKEAYHAGIDAFIAKPFDPELLILKINSLINSYRQVVQNAAIEQKLKPTENKVETNEDRLLAKIKETVEKEIANPCFDQNVLASEIGLSSTQLYRKLRELTKMAPNEFIRKVRLMRAAQMLANDCYSVNEVSYNVGFNDPKYFSRCFSKEIGMSPSKYRDDQVRKTGDDA
ncbi:MAG: ATP-binding protein [Bacteroidales bacterium]|nr:ATP-binding protein [Bacteroidales bacterium]